VFILGSVQVDGGAADTVGSSFGRIWCGCVLTFVVSGLVVAICHWQIQWWFLWWCSQWGFEGVVVLLRW
jgi:hypothetical protein